MKRLIIYVSSLFILSVIGLIMVYSASSIWAEYKTGNQYYYLIRQGLFLIVGFVAFIISYKVPILFWKKYANIIFISSFILLILVLIPGIGIVRGGARSWIGIGDFSIQPAEFVKVSYIIFTAKFLSNYPGIMKKNKYLILYLICTFLIFGLILLQPDFGTGVIFLVSICFMLFISLMKYRNIFIGVFIGVFALVIMIMSAPYRMDRILSYLDPWQDPLGSGFQIIQSLYAISPANLFGYGLFRSKQKFYYLPEPQNDFIFAIIIEELGLLGGIVILCLFLVIIIIGYLECTKINNPFTMYLLFGFTSLLAFQVFINISVVIGLIPVTGVTLPFLSCGGSSLVISLLMMGICANIIKNREICDYTVYENEK